MHHLFTIWTFNKRKMPFFVNTMYTPSELFLSRENLFESRNFIFFNQIYYFRHIYILHMYIVNCLQRFYPTSDKNHAWDLQ